MTLFFVWLLAAEVAAYPCLFLASRCASRLQYLTILTLEMWLSLTMNICAVSLTSIFASLMDDPAWKVLNLGTWGLALASLLTLAVSEPGRLSHAHVEKLPPNPLYYETCDKCELAGKLFHSYFSRCCIAEFDHTCSFIGNDIGKQNRLLFLLYLCLQAVLGAVNAATGFPCLVAGPVCAYSAVPMGVPLLQLLAGLCQFFAAAALLGHYLYMMRLGHTPSSYVKCHSVRGLVKRGKMGIFYGDDGFELFAFEEKEEVGRQITNGDVVLTRLPKKVELEACTIGPYGRGLRAELRRVRRDFKFENRYTYDFSCVY